MYSRVMLGSKSIEPIVSPLNILLIIGAIVAISACSIATNPEGGPSESAVPLSAGDPASQETAPSPPATATRAADTGVAEPPAETLLLLFTPPNGVVPFDERELERAEEAHLRVIADLRSNGMVVASGRLDDAGRLIFIPDLGMSRLGKIFEDDPLYRDFTVQSAGFQFTVGGLCADESSGDVEAYQLVHFERDPLVGEGHDPLAQPLFGSEIEEVDRVVAAGVWGYGHHGFLVLAAPSAEEAETIVQSLPGAGDPPWRHAIQGLELGSGVLCGKPPG